MDFQRVCEVGFIFVERRNTFKLWSTSNLSPHSESVMWHVTMGKLSDSRSPFSYLNSEG